MVTLVSHIWKPSRSRTITMDSFVPVPRGTTATIPTMLSWPFKDPEDILDYQLDIEPALIGNEGDTIESVDVEIDPSQPGDLTLDNVAADGAPGRYLVIQRSGGRDLQCDGKDHTGKWQSTATHNAATCSRTFSTNHSNKCH